MTELPPIYGYMVCKKYLDGSFDIPFEVRYGHNAIEVYIEALNEGVIIIHMNMRDHD